jgi:6-phosphofructokinase 1
MSDIRTIGVTTGGGDCPGLNAVIRAVTKCAILKYGWRVIGIPDGFDGLIFPNRSYELTLASVSGILPRGGTILGTTTRGNPFQYKEKRNGDVIVHDVSQAVFENSKRLEIDAIVIIGGDGTQNIALEFHRRGLKVVGVPKSIDNDLSATEITFGFDTALHTATDAIDKLFTTAESHHRVMLLEVMGRNAGWIALEAGLAGGAHVILLPEIPFRLESICHLVAERDRRGHRFTIIVVAEGAKLPAKLEPEPAIERRAVVRAGSVADVIGDAVACATKKEVRVTVLGHIQRGGSPSPFDRILSTRFGVAAVDLIAKGDFGRMVCLRGGMIQSVPIADAVGVMKCVDPNGEIVRIARSIGTCFAD